jgi:pimeloyl-ACP methyl ester carboxylesterase
MATLYLYLRNRQTCAWRNNYPKPHRAPGRIGAKDVHERDTNVKIGSMAKVATALLLSVALCCPAMATNGKENTMTSTTIAEQIAAHRAELFAQCPIIPVPENANSLPVHITAWGATGPVVFLVHGGVQGGIGGGPINFTGQKGLAEQGWRLRIIDRPGFGQSPSRGPDDMVADARLVAEHLGKSSHLIGHSFGGAEALLAAAQKPEAVRSLVLVEPALQPLLTTDPESLKLPAVLSGLRLVSSALFSAKTPGAFASAFAERLGSGVDGGPNPSAAALRGRPELADVLGCALLRAHTASPADMRKAADVIVKAGIPVLIISGGYDQGQDAIGEALAKLLHGRHIIVRSANHFIQQSSPESFNAAVAAFMREADHARAEP